MAMAMVTEQETCPAVAVVGTKQCTAMKKISFCMFCSVALFCGCNEEGQEHGLVTDEVENVRATIKDFVYDDSFLTRTSISVESDGSHYAWAETDTIGIFPSTGRQVEFSMADGAGSTSATFTGGGWGLKSTSTYAAYYPLIGEYYLDKTKIPVDYTGQVQTGNGSTAHLGAYDYLAAPASEVSNGSVAFNFERLGCLVRLVITIPEPKTLTKMTLNSTRYFTESGTVDLSAETSEITATKKSASIEVGLENIATTETDEQVTIYLMLPPVDLSSSTLTATIDFEDGTNHETDVTGKKLEAGNAYALEEVDRRLYTSTTSSIEPVQDSDGTYLIASASNMKWFIETAMNNSTYTSKTYKLTTDISFESSVETPASSFRGIFDGGGHKLSNLKPSFRNGCVGLFGILYGTVKNLIIENPQLSLTYDDGYYNTYCGALAGEVLNGGTIVNCCVIGGKVSGNKTSQASCHVGGLVGYIGGDNVTFKGCYVSGTTVKGGGSGNTSTHVGGIFGSAGGSSNYRDYISLISCYTKDIVVTGGTYGSFLGYAWLDDPTTSSINTCFYDGSYPAIGFIMNSETFTETTFEALSDDNFASAITQMNVNLTDCDYIFGEDGSFVRRE